MKLNGYGTKNRDFRADVARKDNAADGMIVIPENVAKQGFDFYYDKNTNKVYFVWEDGTLGTLENNYSLGKVGKYLKQKYNIKLDSAHKDMSDSDIATMGQDFRKATQAVMNLEKYAQTDQALNDIMRVTDILNDAKRQIIKNSER